MRLGERCDEIVRLIDETLADRPGRSSPPTPRTVVEPHWPASAPGPRGPRSCVARAPRPPEPPDRAAAGF